MPALREIFASFGIEFDRNRQLERGSQRVSQMTQRVRGLVVAASGAFALRGFARFIRSTIEMGDELDKTSQQVGLTVDQLERLRYVGQLGGVEANEMANALGQLQRRADDAAHGGSETSEAFQRLGVNVRDSNGELRDAHDLFLAVADGLDNLDNASERTALAMELMGRQGRRMLPMMEGGAEGIRRQEEEFTRLTGGSLQEFVNLSRDAQDDMTRFGIVMTSFRARLAVQFLPILRQGIAVLMRWAGAFRDLMASSHIAEAALIALGAVAAGVALATIGTWGPILLVVAAAALLALVIDDLWTAMDGGDSVFTRMGGNVETLRAAWQTLIDIWNEARTTWLNLQDALRGLRGEEALVRTDSGILGELGEVSASYRAGEEVRRTGGIVAAIGRIASPLAGIVSRRTHGAEPSHGALAPATAEVSLPGSIFETTRTVRATPPAPYEVRGTARPATTRVDAPVTIAPTITIHEATDGETVGRIVDDHIRTEGDRQARRLRAALVPEGGT